MKGWIEKLSDRLSSRAMLFIVAGIAIAIFTLRGCSGVNITEQEAIAAATAAFENHEGYFEPAQTQARVLRQGFPSSAVYFVVFTVPAPEGSENDFLHHAEVRVDASSGAVLGIAIRATT